jgi:hypothetical protein
MRILLVEDDLMIGDVVANSLRDASYAVDWMKMAMMRCQLPRSIMTLCSWILGCRDRTALACHERTAVRDHPYRW